MTECSDCPQPSNYAAIALQLQETALQAENCIYELEKSLRMATNPSTTILTTTAAVGTSFDVYHNIMAAASTLTFSNSSITNFNSLLVPIPPGVYQAGLSLTATVTAGVLVDNSPRTAIISVRPIGLFSPLSPDIFTAFEVVYEPNNGNGVDMCLTTTLVVEDRQFVQFGFIHGNTGAATVTVAAGAICWLTRISDRNALRVVT